MDFQQSGDQFTITAELAPPKGTDVSRMLACARRLKGRVSAVNVTDNQGAVMRMGALAACYLLKEAGLEPIYQMTCRDRNRLAIQSDLLGAAALGIKNILVMTGDHPIMGDNPEAKPVFDLDSTQLLQVIGRLNQGRDISTLVTNKEGGVTLKGKTDFFPGAVAAPEAEPLGPQLLRFSKKVAAGARFFQTQAVYDLEKFEKFMEYARKLKARVLAGVLLLRSAGMARYLNRHVPGVSVPEHLIRQLESSAHPLEEGIRIAGRQIRQLEDRCSGVHIMAIDLEERVLDILDEAGR